MNSRIAIFRKRLLSYSETFIADQGQLLPNLQPVYCGYARDDSGIHLLDGSTRVLLADYSSLPECSKFLFRKGLGGASAWIDAIRSQSPELIHAHFFNDGLDAVNLGVRLNLPVITTVHGHDITKRANAVAHSKSVRRFFDRVDRVIAVSKFIAQNALERGCPADKLIQHYIGIDLEKFDQPKQESAEPSLLFVGRLVEKKGCTYLLQAMERLRPKYPALKLTIVGEGSLRSALEQEAAERGLSVEFTGSLDATQIRQRLARCWLFVAPSVTAGDGDAEGLGMVFLEAQALRTPVISFRSGGVVEAIEDGVTGLLCAERDVDNLAANMAELLENESRRHDMGVKGRQRVEHHFDVRKQCAELESIYARIS